MFDSLSDRLQRVMKGLRGEGHLTEFHVDEALKEIRTGLLEADVHLDVVKGFTQRVREKAVGQEVLTAFAPAQQVLKIVQTELVGLLGGSAATLNDVARIYDRKLALGLSEQQINDLTEYLKSL